MNQQYAAEIHTMPLPPPRGPYARLTSLHSRPDFCDVAPLTVQNKVAREAISVSGERTGFAQKDALTVVIEGRPTWRNVTIGASELAAKLLTQYQSQGINAMRFMGGTFSLVIHDAARGELHLAVDRLGVNSLCYSHANGTTIVAPDAERATQNNQISAQAVYDFFFFHMVPSPGSIFSDVHKVPPATVVTIGPDSIDSRAYWEPAFAYERYDERRMGSELRTRLGAAVHRAMLEDNSAAFLSGGLDSSSVVGFAADAQQKSATAFSMGFDVPGYDEVEYARTTAKHFNVPLETYYVKPEDVLATIDVVAEQFGEPFGNSSAIPTYHCARVAREAGHSCILAGDGGDELFAGNDRYQFQLLLRSYGLVPRAVKSNILEPLLDGPFSTTSFFPVQKLRSFVQLARQAMPERMYSYSYIQRYGADTIFTNSFLDTVDAAAPLTHARSIYDGTKTADPIDKMLLMDWRLTLADNDLRKVSSMCDAAGIEVTFPMLDDDVVDFSTSIEGMDKMQHGRLRHFYKRAMRGFLAPETLTKPKHGFGLPFGPWLKQSPELMARSQDGLASFKARNIIRSDYIENLQTDLVNEHAGYFGEMVWSILTLESWLARRPGLGGTNM